MKPKKKEQQKRNSKIRKKAAKIRKQLDEKLLEYQNDLNTIKQSQLPEDFCFETRKSLKKELSLINEQIKIGEEITKQQFAKLVNTIDLLTLKKDSSWLSDKQQEMIKNFEQGTASYFRFKKSFNASETFKSLNNLLSNASVDNRYKKHVEEFLKTMDTEDTSLRKKRDAANHLIYNLTNKKKINRNTRRH